MLLRLVFFLNFFLVASVAHADPITAIGLVISGAQALATGASLLTIVVRAVLGIGLSLLQQALNRQKNKPSAMGSVLEIKMGDDQPMTFPVGSRAVGGRRKYIGSWGSAGGTPNAYLTDVIEISNLPSYAGPLGITSLWIGQKKCGVLWDRPHPDGRGYPIAEFFKPNGTAYMWIKYYDGTQTAADPFLVSKFGSHPDRPYGPDRIGLGCQYVIVTTRLDNDLALGGSPPEVLVEPHPTPFYDPRKDSTNGGSGSHRYGNWSTYEPTVNPMVAIYNIARGIYYTPDEWIFGGQNVAPIRLPNAAWFAAMNECDRDNGKGVAQYRCGIEVQCDQEPLDVIEDLRVACAGRLAEVGGMIKPLVGAPGAAVFSFTDDDILITEEKDFEPFPSLTATHNSISGTYPEPDQRWTVTDAPEQRNLDQEAEDGQRSLPAPVRFEAVPYSEQVQHLMKTMAAEQRRFRIHTLTLPPSAWALEPNNVTSWSSAYNSYGNKKFIVTAITGSSGMLQRVTLLEIDPTDYDPPTVYVPPPSGWIGPITTPSQPMTGWSAEPATIKDAGGIDRRPAIKISSAQDLEDVAGVWVQVRLKATGDVVFDSDSNQYASPFSWIISGNWMISNTDYEARGRYLPQSNRATDWSAWLTVKTPNVLIQAADVLDGAIVQSKIADAAVSAAKIMDEAVSNLKLANQAVSTAKLQVAAVTADVLASGAVISAKLADGAVTAAKLAQGAVDATSLASSIKAVEVVSALPSTGNVEGRQVFLTTDGKLYRYHNGVWTAAVAAGDVNGTLNSSQIADNAITNNKLAALAVDASKLADGSVSAAKLAANAVDATKFASGIRPVEIVSSLPTTGNIEGRTVYLTTDDKLYRYTGTAWTSATAAADIAGQIVGTQISDGAISTPKLAAGSVIANTLAAGAVTADKIAANSITAGQIAAGAIGATQIAAKAITAEKLLIANLDNMIDLGFTTGSLAAWQTIGFNAYYLETGASPMQNTYLVSCDARDSVLVGPTLVRVSPGESYNISVWFYNLDPTYDAYIGVYIKDQSGNNVAPAWVGIATNSAKSAWTQMQGNFTVPAGVYQVQPTFGVAKPAPNGKNGFWGKPNMRRASGAELIVDGAITATKVAANAISAVNIAANAITADKLVIADMTNRVENPNFAYGATSWGLTAGLSVITDASNAYTGSNYLNIAAPAAFTFNRNSNIFPVIPGEQYFLQTFAKRTGAPSDTVSCRMRFMASDKITFLTAIGVIVPTTTPTTYTEYNTSITVPAGAVWAWVDVVPTSTLTGAGSYQIGFVSCQRKSGGNLIVDGAVTADKIAANAVTAGKVAANAVTAGTVAANAVTAGTIAAGAVSAAQIAAGAITADKLAAGSVSTQALAVGNGNNYLTNSDLSAGLTGWAPEYSNEAASFRLSLRTDTFAPQPGAIEIYQSNGTQGIEYGVWPVDAYGVARLFAVKASGWYELSVYYLGHRCVGVQPYLQFLDSSDNHITYYQWGIFPASQNIDPSKNLANYQRFWAKVQMPANAAKVRVFFRMKGTVAGQGDSYLWLARMYFGEANANQTDPSPWSDGSITVIAGGNIATNAITADKIAANAVTADDIAANAVTAGKIAAGAVTATTIAGGTITGDKLAANTIGANQIAAGAITAKQLVLTDYSNMADNGWQTGTLDGWVTQNVQNFYNDTGSTSDSAGWVLQSLGRDIARSNFVAVTPGETYAFDVWVYNADPGRASIFVGRATPSGAVSYAGVIGTDTKNTWTRLQGRYVVPTGITKLAMLLQVEKTAGTGSSCYWSKPVMRRAVSAELIVDGAITANKIAVNSLDAITANLGAVNISSAVIGSLQVGTSNIQGGAVTAVSAGRNGAGQTIGAGQTVNLAACGITVAGDGRVVISAMTLGQFNQNGGSQNSQPIGCNIFRDGTAIFSQTYYLGVVQTVVSGTGGQNGSTSQTTYTAGMVAVPALYDAPGAGYHTYTLQIYCPGNTIVWNESNIIATAFKR